MKFYIRPQRCLRHDKSCKHKKGKMEVLLHSYVNFKNQYKTSIVAIIENDNHEILEICPICMTDTGEATAGFQGTATETP